jgi:transcriptional regulator with XRE-family HTH domain
MLAKIRKTAHEIALRLQQLRNETGLSIKEMAARLGITGDAYAKNERGLNIPNIETLRRLNQDFDISMDWLLFERGPMLYNEKGKRELELEKRVEEMTAAEAGLSNETAALRQEVEDLKSQLAEEYQKQELLREEQTNSLEMNPEVRELLDYMKKDKVFFHRLMLNFEDFKHRQKEIDLTAANPDHPVSSMQFQEPPEAGEGIIPDPE